MANFLSAGNVKMLVAVIAAIAIYDLFIKNALAGIFPRRS